MTKLEKINLANYSYKFFSRANKSDSNTVMKSVEPKINLMNKMNTPKFKTLAVASVIALSAGIAGFFSGKNTQKDFEEDYIPAPIEQKDVLPIDLPEFAEPTELETVYVVKENDNIWNISKAKLQEEGNTNPANGIINKLKDEIVRMNPQVKDGGNLIYAGDELKLPVLDVEI